MEEIHCPMCGNPNPGDAEVCEHCGARLVPLEAGEDSGESEDWLNRIRGEAGEGAQFSDSDSELDPGEASEPDLDQPPPSEGASAEAEGEEVPDWLQRIREKQAGEPELIPAEDEPSPEDALREAVGEDEPPAEERLRAESLEEEPIPEDALRAAAVGGEPEAEEPTLEDALRAAATAGEPEAEEPSLEDALRAAAAEGEPEAPEPAPEESLRATLEQPPEESVPGPPPASEPAAEPDPAPGEEPAAGAESPDWLEAMEGEGAEGDLPHVPALIGGQDEPDEPELGDLGLPDWLGEVEPLEDEPPAEAPGEGPDLAPATLPNWLEAMRPVDTFRSVVEIESEDDQAVESVGPLAGLSGVLLAEPVVAMPRTSSVGSMQLDVSERQYAQAELLHRLVDEEEIEAPAKPKLRARLAIFRWAIAAVVLVAVSLPIITGAPTFPLPGLEPRELGALFDKVQGVSSDEPVLVVFDYEPGYAGELEAVSGAFLDQLMGRGLLLATMSTRPTGPALAVRAVNPFVQQHAYENGQGIVHLGYLSGGPTAVQLFAVNPRAAVLKGFNLPDEVKEAGQTAWETPVLADVQTLSDFGMVAVITADSETARVWAEQARPNMGDSELVVVLSAGAEPLVRPYFEREDPKVGGILSGLPAAAAYELRNGRLGLAQKHWNAFGTAMIAAQLVLLAGVGYGALLWWRTRP